MSPQLVHIGQEGSLHWHRQVKRNQRKWRTKHLICSYHSGKPASLTPWVAHWAGRGRRTIDSNRCSPKHPLGPNIERESSCGFSKVDSTTRSEVKISRPCISKLRRRKHPTPEWILPKASREDLKPEFGRFRSIDMEPLRGRTTSWHLADGVGEIDGLPVYGDNIRDQKHLKI